MRHNNWYNYHQDHTNCPHPHNYPNWSSRAYHYNYTIRHQDTPTNDIENAKDFNNYYVDKAREL